MRATHIKPRVGTLQSQRPFYAWYLAQKRLARRDGASANARTIESSEERSTEDGLSRETE